MIVLLCSNLCKLLQHSSILQRSDMKLISTCFHVVPGKLIDQKDSIKVEGLNPEQKYTLTSETQTDSGNKFGSIAYYQADKNGTINLEKHTAIGGMYSGVQPMGWLWSMKPSPYNSRSHARLLKADSSTPLKVKLKIKNGDHCKFKDIFSNSRNNSVCNTVVEKWWTNGRVRKVIIDDGKVKGALFLPDGNPPYPGVISMYGGVLTAITHEFRPSMLATHGFATLSLEFMKGIETFYGNLDLTILENAVKFMHNHPDINSDSIGVYGISKGGSLALAMGAYIPGIKCVVAVNCSIFSDHSKLTYKGRSWPSYAIDFNIMTESTIYKDCFSMHPMFTMPDDPETEAKDSLIEFYKNKNVSYLYTASMGDTNTPTAYYVEHVEKLFKKYNHPQYEVTRYQNAGHLLEQPYMPVCEVSYAPLIDAMLTWGGSPEENNIAQEKSWNKHLQFLGKNLKMKPKL